ncbi:ATP-binding protein [Aetokthonos hydrillicola Thurmond2011]|jgi:signal transduction histidine kinase|uniref:histidine kinase n=1 Tax=Aetokthonos hydrillicola Thurmond2011 TaxID=2712845 RepID=A0AAP5MAJ9_9CYAN|nr:ATP-binding protein [Aetokthonos hydrillicola]MBO3460937.1 histidine kinase [Aetokthonos hydrillicola CCALA 1050]MBW4583608.1 CHASE3 domain-containing protein [Aetokthonos hydrillicola CCALA 1050]MDR9895699.1 ATP-binding protein [Aetokthonos hydrillicola Thurmond2011]
MKWSLVGKWNVFGFGLALLLIGIDSMISYQNAIKLIQNADKVKHTHEVLKNLTDIHATLTDSESNLLSYTLFKDESELKRYNAAIESISPKIKILKQLNAGNTSQQQRLATLQSLISQKQILFKQSIDVYKAGQSTAQNQYPLIVRSKRSRDQIRMLIIQMQAEEEKLLELWVKKSEHNIRSRIFIEFLSIFLSFAILFGVYALLYRQMVKRHKAETLQIHLSQEKELSDLKLRFFSMVSHEFRTPLSIILGSAQLLAENSEQWTQSKRLKNLERIQSSAKLMTKLLSDILTIERAEAGKLECNRELVDLEAFCLNLVEDIHLGSNNRHEIKFLSDDGCTRAELDEKLLYSILSNLLSNAIKYSPNGGNIYFVLSCEAEVVSFQIKDEGIGIPEEFQQQLYEPFHRSYNVRDIVGVGLGLAVVKKCLDIHQGEISVESQEGIGTTFTVRIPLPTK